MCGINLGKTTYCFGQVDPIWACSSVLLNNKTCCYCVVSGVFAFALCLGLAFTNVTLSSPIRVSKYVLWLTMFSLCAPACAKVKFK